MPVLRRKLLVAASMLPLVTHAQSSLSKGKPVRVLVGFAPGTPPEGRCYYKA